MQDLNTHTSLDVDICKFLKQRERCQGVAITTRFFDNKNGFRLRVRRGTAVNGKFALFVFLGMVRVFIHIAFWYKMIDSQLSSNKDMIVQARACSNQKPICNGFR